MARSKKEYLDEILNSLSWLGLDWDEIYYQSERFQLYRDYAHQLLSKGLAYKDGEAIIFKVTPRKIIIRDLIRKEPIEFDASVIKDQVLIKSDLSPTYNFACVIDDALMKVSHIIRETIIFRIPPSRLLCIRLWGFLFRSLPICL